MPAIVWRTAARLLLQKKAIAVDNAAAKQPSAHKGTYTIDWAGRIGLLRASLH